MKKVILMLSLLLYLVSCGGNKKQEPEVVEFDRLPVQSSEVISEPISDSHNARNSLDYQGVYKGTLLYEDSLGDKITLELRDSTYVKTIIDIKSGEKSVYEGKYTWTDDGSVIMLLDEKLHNLYFVGENVLFILDLDGNKIEGELAEQYKLYKEE